MAAVSSASASMHSLLERLLVVAVVVLRRASLSHLAPFFSIVGEQRRVLGLQVLVQAVFERQHLLDVDVVEVALVHREQRRAHQADRQRRVLRLLEQFGHARAAVELLARGFVEVGGELRERGQLAVLRQVGTDAAGQALDQLRLRGAADARHRDAGVDGGADAGVEQRRFQEDLAVGDRDHVGRHEGGHVAGLRLDDRQRGQRAGLALDLALGEVLDVVGVHARGALEQAAVEIEHVAGIGFAARRAAQQQRDLAVGDGLLGQVVIDDQRVLAAVAEVLAHRAARVRATRTAWRPIRKPRRRRRWCTPSRRLLRARARRS